jgi:hypothetical protein
MDALVPLVVGFVLTTVLGGLLGTYLQRRTWDHQNRARLRQEDLRHAGDVCRAVSELLDKRRYRMLRLFFAVRGRARETVSAEVLAERFSGYDQVLYEWNAGLDGLGARLAELDGIAHRFSVLMMVQLRDGTVGGRAPQPLGPPRLETERD